jgi:hypothetical protein
MKQQTKEFLTKLAALMQEYEVELEITESCHGYGGFSVAGLEIEIGVKNSIEEYDYWNTEYVELSGKNHNAEDVLELIEKETNK